MARRVIVHGRVQGVGFRYFTIRAAEGLAVTGYVRNLPGGEVEVVVEGDAADVERLLGHVRRGPRGGRVDRVDTHDIAVSGRYRGFDVVP